MKKKKTKSKPHPTEAIPFPENTFGASPSVFGPLQSCRITGKLGENFPLAFSLSLPSLPQRETRAYLEKLRLHYYRFLEREAQKKCDHVRFAALDWHLEKNTLFLFTTLGPFEKREQTLAATLTLDEKGNIMKIGRKKKGP
ncbi:MAG: hypothetical protein IKD18_06500 [Clostridia bacterium]|nr:hypothetical protein [Clostridia bacterium]